MLPIALNLDQVTPSIDLFVCINAIQELKDKPNSMRQGRVHHTDKLNEFKTALNLL